MGNKRSDDEIWFELSQEIDADFRRPGFFSSAKVILSYRRWKITLDTCEDSSIDGPSYPYTRISALYDRVGDFSFKVHRRDIFSRIGRIWDKLAWDMQEIETGDPFFDEKLVVRGSPEVMVRELFDNDAIREHIGKEPSIYFKTKKAGWFTPMAKLYLEAGAVITDKESLKNLFELFTLTLDELSRMGFAV